MERRTGTSTDGADDLASAHAPTRALTQPVRCGHPRRRAARSRWAAIGAAVAVSLGAGGLAVVGASSSPASSFVAVTPERVLDTRVGLGLDGPLVSPTGRDLPITGTIPTPGGAQVVVPDGATAVALNVTVVQPAADGFVSVRPSGTPGTPTTSNLNFSAGAVVPNAVIVALPTSGSQAGSIELLYDALGAVGPTTDLLVDVTGFFAVAEGSGSTVTGPQGPEGPAGPAGPAGPQGEAAFEDERVVHVAINGTPDGSNGAFDSVQAAVDSITEASPTTRYLVKIGPGVFEGRVSVGSHIHLEGSGVGVTTLTAPGSNQAVLTSPASSTVYVDGATGVGIRSLTVRNTGGSGSGNAIGITGASTQVVIDDVDAASTGSSVFHAAVATGQSEVIMSRMRIAAGGGDNTGIGVWVTESLVDVRATVVTATGAATATRGLLVSGGSIVSAHSVSVRAGGGSSSSAGIVNVESEITIESSDIRGGDDAVLNEPDMANPTLTQIGGSRLDGGVSGVPVFRCAASYDDQFAELNPDCIPT
jgi:hypothetical protein